VRNLASFKDRDLPHWVRNVLLRTVEDIRHLLCIKSRSVLLPVAALLSSAAAFTPPLRLGRCRSTSSLQREAT